MKTAKKVISLVMAVIMLFTGTPALQASDLAFDRAQLAELQKEILPDVKPDLNQVKDPVQELIARRNEMKNHSESLIVKFEQLIKSIAESTKIDNIKNAVQLMERASKKIQIDPRFEKIPEDEQMKVAISTVLVNRISVADKSSEDFAAAYASIALMLAGIGIFWVIFGEGDPIKILEKIGIEITDRGLCAGALIAAILMMVIAVISSGSYLPVISSSSSDDEAFEAFSEKPFELLSKFGEPDFYIMYNRGPKSAEILTDTQDILYYTARKGIDIENSIDIIKTKTVDWRVSMSAKDRAYCLHERAESLRAEATSFRW